MVNNQYINPWTKQELIILNQKYPTQGFHIPELLKTRTKCGINNKAHKLKIKWNGRLKRIDISGRLKEIFDGIMLGDGGLSAPARGKKTAILTLAQTESKKDFADYVLNLLKDEGVQTRYTTGGEERDTIICGRSAHTNKSVRIITRSYLDLRNEMIRWGYKDKIGKTKIPDDISISPLTLAIFYMGDGSIVQHKNRKNPNYRIQFSTECFDKESIIKFRNKLEQKYNWNCKITLHTSKKYVINIYNLPNVLNFLEITKSYMVDCFAYKWKPVLNKF